VHKLEALVNSYADAYRVQLHRISGVSGQEAGPGQMEEDLNLLAHRKTEAAPDLDVQRA